MKKNMVKETQSELKKVIWPTKKTVLNGTAVVAAMVVLVGAIILVFDFLSGALVKKLIEEFSISNTEYSESDVQDAQVDNSTEQNEQTPADENSEPTIDNNEVTE